MQDTALQWHRMSFEMAGVIFILCYGMLRHLCPLEVILHKLYACINLVIDIEMDVQMCWYRETSITLWCSQYHCQCNRSEDKDNKIHGVHLQPLQLVYDRHKKKKCKGWKMPFGPASIYQQLHNSPFIVVLSFYIIMWNKCSWLV